MAMALDPQALQELDKKLNGLFGKFFRTLGLSIVLTAFAAAYISRKGGPFFDLGLDPIYLRGGALFISIMDIGMSIVLGRQIGARTIDEKAGPSEEIFNRFKKIVLMRFVISMVTVDLGFFLFLLTRNDWDYYGLSFIGLLGYLLGFVLKRSEDQ